MIIKRSIYFVVIADWLVAPVTLMTINIVEAKPDFIVGNCACPFFKIEAERTNALQLATIYLTYLFSISLVGSGRFSIKFDTV